MSLALIPHRGGRTNFTAPTVSRLRAGSPPTSGPLRLVSWTKVRGIFPGSRARANRGPHEVDVFVGGKERVVPGGAHFQLGAPRSGGVRRHAGPLDAGFSAAGARPPSPGRCKELRFQDTRPRLQRGGHQPAERSPAGGRQWRRSPAAWVRRRPALPALVATAPRWSEPPHRSAAARSGSQSR